MDEKKTMLRVIEDFKKRSIHSGEQVELFTEKSFLAGTCAGERVAYDLCARILQAAIEGNF